MINDAGGIKNPSEVVARMCTDLTAAGVPVDRCHALVRTLHPHIAGRSFLWMPGRHVEVAEHSYDELLRPEVDEFSYIPVFRKGVIIRKRLVGEKKLTPDLIPLAEDGYTDFFAGPLKFISGQIHGIFFATRHPDGFSDDDIHALERVLGPLSRIGEIFALMRTATNLLNTYVGHDAGARIMAGQIQRGETNSIHAVIWFSDLRGFTSMSGTLQPAEIISTLNSVFDCQVPFIELHGGHVLKFIGDGLLAIFPCSDNPASQAESALAAVAQAFSSLDALNDTRVRDGNNPLRFGVALHLGDVAYGNIGGANRLDFTCIGPSVNLAARLETLTSKVDKNLIVSDEIARLITVPLEPLGEFDLKGVGTPVKAFAVPFIDKTNNHN
ncbi:MAG: adenylate/guanylate cyclase domain-containing protein [Bacteroidota bacterium]